MKNILILIVISTLSLLISCSDEQSTPQDTNFVKVERGGCANGLPPGGIIQTEKTDTVYHYIKDNHLFIYIGFEATCCILYDYKTEINSNEIEIELNEASNDPCDCICWYEFTFEFKDMEKILYNYTIKIEDYLVFTGKIDLRE